MRIRETMLAVAFGYLAVVAAGITALLLGSLLAYLGTDHPWGLALGIVPLTAGAALYARRRRVRRADTTALPVLHPGIRIHAISPRGGIGAVFVLGYLFMFLSRFPQLLPVAAGLLVFCGLAAALLVAVRAGQRPQAGVVLGIGRHD